MALPPEEWIESSQRWKRYETLNTLARMRFISNMQQGSFLRDPIRMMHSDPSHFRSPADGFIVYQEVVDHDEEVVPIKGIRYAVDDVLEHELDTKCLVIGIFMTYFDVHVNRMPTRGKLRFKFHSPMMTTNMPMDDVENDLLTSRLRDLFPNMGEYVKFNARMVNTIRIPGLDYEYYLTQIADDDVNLITHFTTEQDHVFQQTERFSFVRWGSQVELILPLDDRLRFTTTCPIGWHVEGSRDRLVHMEIK